MTLPAESMPQTPNAVAAVSGEKPASTRNATSCTTIANIATAVKKNACAMPQ